MGLSEHDLSHPFIPYPSKPQLRFLNVSGCCAALTCLSCLSCRGCHLRCRKISPWKKWMFFRGMTNRQIKSRDILNYWNYWNGIQYVEYSHPNHGKYWNPIEYYWKWGCEWDLTLSMLLHQQSWTIPRLHRRHLLFLMFRRHIAPTLEFLSIRTLANIHYMGWLPTTLLHPSSYHLCNYNN